MGEPEPGSLTAFGVAAAISALRTSTGDLLPADCRYRAAAPATCGAAIDVPESCTIAESLAIDAESIATPGANTSSTGPKFENHARASFESVAPTVIASATRAGDVVLASTLELPAATT